MIGRYPTEIQPLSGLSRPGWELWVKRDDQTNPMYGGNKVRKLDHILEQARARGSKRIVTFGAAGSHHVLATTLFGRQAGFRVAAVMVPQPYHPHAEDNLRAAIGLGLEAHPARHFAIVPGLVARILRKGDYLLPPGGSDATGTLGYIDAAAELASQITAGAIPTPDVVVVALGSGGTAAGLLAGLALHNLATKVVGVRVVEPWMAGAFRTATLARRAARHTSHTKQPSTMSDLRARLIVQSGYLGKGYAHPTPAGAEATGIAREFGLDLDPVYTAKTFAAVLDRRASNVRERVLYWHTFSSAPMAPLLANAPAASDLPDDLRALLIRR